MIGIDIVKIDRIVTLVEKDKNYKVFSRKEILYAETKCGQSNDNRLIQKKYECLAGIFAAKEAFLKAFGLGIGGQLRLGDVEIDHLETGKPFVVLNDDVKKLLKDIGVSNMDVSISHDGEYAVAVVEII